MAQSHHRRLLGIRSQLRDDLAACRTVGSGDQAAIDRIAASAQDALDSLARCRISTPNDLEDHLLNHIDQLAGELNDLMTIALVSQTSD